MSNAKYNTREEWLIDFAKAVEPIIRSRTGLPIKPYKLSCGWPSRGGTSAARRCIGQCFPSEERNAEIFISPTIDTAREVAETTVHEMLHAFLPPGAGHRKPFSRAAKAVGLEGKPTQTVAGEELVETLKAITDELGPYPHARLEVGPPRDKGRLRKVQCPDCGYILRTTTKWIEECGAPVCPNCQVVMLTDDEIEEEVETPLIATDATIEYRVKGDDRFNIRLIRSSRNIKWFVLDYFPTKVRADSAERFEVPPVKLTPAESREDALNLIQALREGLMTYEDTEVVDDLDAPNDGEADPRDAEDLLYLDEDEEEDPDYVDSILSPEELAEYEFEQGNREQWVKEEA